MLNSLKLLRLFVLSAGLAAALTVGCLDQSSDQSSVNDEGFGVPLVRFSLKVTPQVLANLIWDAMEANNIEQND